MEILLEIIPLNEAHRVLDSNFPYHYYDPANNPTGANIVIPTNSQAYKKGEQLLFGRDCLGVELPTEQEPMIGITIETLETFFDNVAEWHGIEWRF